MSLVDDLRAQAAGLTAPAAAPSVPPELAAAMINPPPGFDASSVLVYFQQHGTVPVATPAPAETTAAPGTAAALRMPAATPVVAPVVAAPEPPPAAPARARGRQPKSDRLSLLVACASGGLSPEQARAYLELSDA